VQSVERDTAWAMSEENVEIVRRGFAAANRGDFERALEDWAPDAIWDWSNSRGFDAGVFREHGEIRAFWHRFLEAFDEIRFELDDLVEVDDDLLIVENVAYLRGRDGIEAQARSAWLVTIRDGKQTSLTSTRRSRKPSKPPGCGSRQMPVGAAIAVGAVIGLALGIVVSVTTDVPLAPEFGAVLGGLIGWLSRRDGA
jgi:ketosteroid isomerase-like protein